MAIFQRSKNTVLAQLSAIRAEIDRELACKLPNYRKISTAPDLSGQQNQTHAGSLNPDPLSQNHQSSSLARLFLSLR